MSPSVMAAPQPAQILAVVIPSGIMSSFVKLYLLMIAVNAGVSRNAARCRLISWSRSWSSSLTAELGFQDRSRVCKPVGAAGLHRGIAAAVVRHRNELLGLDAHGLGILGDARPTDRIGELDRGILGDVGITVDVARVSGLHRDPV